MPSALHFYQREMERRQIEGGRHGAAAARLVGRFDAPTPPAGARRCAL
jgi:hypothetical protein